MPALSRRPVVWLDFPSSGLFAGSGPGSLQSPPADHSHAALRSAANAPSQVLDLSSSKSPKPEITVRALPIAAVAQSLASLPKHLGEGPRHNRSTIPPATHNEHGATYATRGPSTASTRPTCRPRSHNHNLSPAVILPTTVLFYIPPAFKHALRGHDAAPPGHFPHQVGRRPPNTQDDSLPPRLAVTHGYTPDLEFARPP